MFIAPNSPSSALTLYKEKVRDGKENIFGHKPCRTAPAEADRVHIVLALPEARAPGHLRELLLDLNIAPSELEAIAPEQVFRARLALSVSPHIPPVAGRVNPVVASPQHLVEQPVQPVDLHISSASLLVQIRVLHQEKMLQEAVMTSQLYSAGLGDLGRCRCLTGLAVPIES